MDDSIVMLESGDIPSPLDKAMLAVAMISIKGEDTVKAPIANLFLQEIRRLLYETENNFVKSKIGKYNIIFVKGEDKQ